MPKKRDLSMLKADALKMKLAMADATLGVMDLAAKSGVSPTTVSFMVGGKFIKPAYFGKVAKALDKRSEDLIEI